MSLSRTLLVVLAMLVAICPSSAQSQVQTLPQGFDLIDGNFSTNFPFHSSNESVWQFHYDSGEFVASGPIQITELWVRMAIPAFPVAAFDFDDVEITLIEAATDYRVNSHVPIFSDNVNRAEIVRTGPFTGPAQPRTFGPVGRWVRLGLQRSFTYDPSAGKDFIVQIKTCGINATFGERIDGRNQPAGNLGGNRYGSNASCTATSQTTQSNEAVPIIRIAWRDVETQTLPAGFENTMANSSTTAPFNQPNDQRWQWHYDHAQFQATGPISITDISFRPNSPTAQPAAIDISSLEVVMIESSSSFEPASHPLTFSGSVLRQRVVRAGPFTNATLKPSSGGVSNWISLQLDKAFTYDPTSGHDFIVEVRACGINTPLGDNIDLASSSSTTAFGNRYGHTSNCTIDQINSFTFSNLVPVLKLDYVSVVKSPPYYESFDLAGSPGPAEWSQDAADSSQDWLYFNRSTPSANTGPLSDRTTRQEFDGFYAYIEDSGEENDPVVLVTPWFDLSGMTNPEFSFWYSSFDNLDVGISNNLLKVQRETMGSAPQTMFTIFPAANLDWRFMRFTLSGASGGMTRIIFSGETDNGGFSNDIAIDDFRVYDRQDLGGQPAGVNRSFDINEALDVNGIPVGFANQVNGPFFAEATLGESYRMRFRAMPNEAILLLGGTLSPAAQIFPQGVFDLSNSFVVVNGAGSGFLESVFRADFNGELDMDLTVPASIPAGTKFALQPINFVTGPQVIELANAVEVTIKP